MSNSEQSSQQQPPSAATAQTTTSGGSTPPVSGGQSRAATQLKASLRGHDFATQVQMLAPENPGSARDTSVHAAAARGIGGSGGELPYGEQIQRSFGGYDLSNVQAHADASATAATAAMGADAYATGNHVVLGAGGKDLHTVAHEAAHVVQQQSGVSLSGGIGQAGDPYERHADAVADRVVQGKSAEGLLGEMAGDEGCHLGAVQMQEAVSPADSSAPPAATEGTNQVVASMQADFVDPLTDRVFSPGPQDIATYADASRFAGSCDRFILGVLQLVPGEHPHYESLASAMWGLAGRATAWAGNGGTFQERDIETLNGLVAAAHDALGALADAMHAQTTDITWQFPNVGVTRAGRVSGKRAHEALAFAQWTRSRLTPLAQVIEQTPGSQFADEMNTVNAEWDALIGELGPFGSEVLLPSHWDVFGLHLVPATETLLRSMEEQPFRSIDISLPSPFQLAGAREVTTYNLLDNAVNALDTELRFRENDIFHPSIPTADAFRQRYDALRRDLVRLMVDEVGDAGQSQGWEHPITPEHADWFQGEIEQVQWEVGDLFGAMDAQSREARQGAARAVADNAVALEALRDLQRQCFLVGNESELPVLATMAGYALSFGDELNGAMLQMTGRGMFGSASSYASAIPAVLAKGFTLANLAMSWGSSTPLSQGTPLEGMVALNNAVGLMGAVTGIWTSPATLFTAHIGPLVAAISTMMTRLQLRLIAHNDIWVELGYDPLYINAEPGGMPMWRYMSTVMQADGPSAISPPTGEVFDYFETFRSRFDTATSEPMATDGGWFGVTGIDKDLDPEEFKTWVFNHRATVWASLYGARRPPSPR